MIGLFLCVLWAFNCPASNCDRLTLNVGIVPSEWTPIFEQVIKSTYLDFDILRYELDLSDAKNGYDEVMTAYSLISSKQTNIIIGTFNKAVNIASERLGVPYISLTEITPHGLNSTFQMVPALKDTSTAVLDMTARYQWDKVGVFYDSDEGRVLLETLMTNHDLTIKSFRMSENSDDQTIKDYLVGMRKIFIKKTVVMCTKNKAEHLLEQAKILAVLSDPYQWFFHDPGAKLGSIFDSYTNLSVNLTVFTVLPFNKQMENINQDEKYVYALIKDIMKVLNTIVRNIDPKTTGTNLTNVVRTRLRKTNMQGLTTNIKFRDSGIRDNVTLTITEIAGAGTTDRTELGYWRPSGQTATERLHLYPRAEVNRTVIFPLRKRVVKVVTILEKPFTMLVEDHKNKTGNARFEGFAVDIINEVAGMLDFEMELYLVHDGQFGSKGKDGEWNGIIGELLAGNATMSIAPLSVNSAREEAVDFTKPFMTRHISVLIKMPNKGKSYFEFLDPLSREVWMCTFGAFTIVSIILYVLERVGNTKKNYPHISFRESFWFIFGSLLQGNTDASPCTVPGRIMTSAWWFFALILISSYTANLAAFLTVRKINTPIQSVTDLAQQTNIKYGTVVDSGIMFFFKHTKVEVFQQMWAQMSVEGGDMMVHSTDEGFERVKHGNYAFFWDNTVNRYKTIEDCSLTQVGPPFDRKDFGIGVPPGATYKTELGMAVLRLGNRGFLHYLESRWWYRRDCGEIDNSSTDETSELQIENVAGVFFILIGGIIIAGLACLAEYVSKKVFKVKEPEKKFEEVVNDKEKESFL